MSSRTGKVTQLEIELSKNIVENIFSKGKIDPVGEAIREVAPQMSSNEKQQMAEMINIAANITGIKGMAIESEEPKITPKPTNPTKPTKGNDESTKLTNVISEAVRVIEGNHAQIPGDTILKVIEMSKRIKTYENFLLRFVQKYR